MDRAIIDAVVELLAEEGVDALTVDAVAARAGVGRASIYRRHANRTALLVAACEAVTPGPPPTPDTGDVRQDLVEVARWVARLLQRSDAGRLLPTMIAQSAGHPEVREALAIFKSQRSSPTTEVVQRAIDRGDLPAGTDAELVTDLLVGSIIYRTLLRVGRTTSAQLAQLVDMVLDGITARS